MIWNYIFVITGGAIGSAFRYTIFRLFPNLNFPWATMSVNIIGSFLIGILYAYLQDRTDGNTMRLFLMTGVLGGFTTFSAFSLETLYFYKTDRWARRL